MACLLKPARCCAPSWGSLRKRKPHPRPLTPRRQKSQESEACDRGPEHHARGVVNRSDRSVGVEISPRAPHIDRLSAPAHRELEPKLRLGEFWKERLNAHAAGNDWLAIAA